MEVLEIKKDNAIKAYNSGCADVKKVMETLFGASSFRALKITDRIKTFEDACNSISVNDTTSVGIDADYFDSLNFPADEIAYKKLKIIAEALNEGWKPNWSNRAEYKYYPWFDLSSGSGLSYYGYVDRRSASYVGSRLCFKSRELAEYAGKQFISIYTDFFIIK